MYEPINYMINISGARDRLRRRADLESELQARLEDTRRTLPAIEWQDRQKLENRDDYEELFGNFYSNPTESEVPVDHERITYTISDVELTETGRGLYDLKRLFGKAEFESRLRLDLDFEDEHIFNVYPHKHPLYEEMNITTRKTDNVTKIRLFHDWEGWESFSEAFMLFNVALAHRWASPDTFEGLTEKLVDKELYKTFGDQLWRD